MKLDELEIISKPTIGNENKAVPANPPQRLPGGFTVMILNDPVTPFEVVIEAIVSGARLSPEEATKRMMHAHTQGWAPIAAYASKDVAETVASRIMSHARGNDKYDHYREYTKHNGPWPLTAEVMEAGDK